MNVRVEFFGAIRAAAGTPEIALALADGATVADLLTEVFARYPAVAGQDSQLATRANFDPVTRDHVLRQGEVISLLPLGAEA